MRIGTQDLKVGQEVAIAAPGFSREHYCFGYVVTRLTDGGQVVVKRPPDPNSTIPHQPRRFNSDGYEIGGGASSRYRRAYLLDAAKARACTDLDKQRRMAAHAVEKVRVDTVYSGNKTHLLKKIDELKDLLANAEALVNGIPE